jgi:hypothetical protein
MDVAQGLVALLDRRDDDPESNPVVDLFDGDILDHEFFVDAVKMLGAAQDPEFLEAMLGQLLVEQRLDLVHVGFPIRQGGVDLGGEILVFVGMEMREGEILQLALEPVDAQPAGQGGIEIHGFLGEFHLFLARDMAQGLHVVQPVGQFDQQNPDVRRHGQEEFADILRLVGEAAVELDIGDLGGALDDVGDIIAKGLAEFFLRFLEVLGLFEHPVQEARAEGGNIKAHGGQDVGDHQGVVQIGAARKPMLARVKLLGKIMGLAEQDEVFLGHVAPGPFDYCFDGNHAVGAGNGPCLRPLTRAEPERCGPGQRALFRLRPRAGSGWCRWPGP